MKKARTIEMPNFLDIPFSKALEIALLVSGKTLEDIAEELGKGYTTVQRYFTDPTYDPPARLIPRLCEVLGNDILLEWISVLAGGCFIRNVESPCDLPLEIQVAHLTKEFSEVLSADGQARLDGKYNTADLSLIQKELLDLKKVSNRLLKAIEIRRQSA